MSWLVPLALFALHAVHWLVCLVKSSWNSFKHNPNPLAAERRKRPAHLALVLVADHAADPEETEDIMVESAERAAAWCRTAGIARLTVYDREGVLTQASSEIRERLSRRFDASSGDSSASSDVEFPLTPPPSDDSESRPLSPATTPSPLKLHVTTIHALGSGSQQKKRSIGKAVLKRRRPSRKDSNVPSLTVHIACRQSGKPAIASAATQLLEAKPSEPVEICVTSEQEFNLILEGDNGLPSPDLMLVHRVHRRQSHKSPLELHGFPPWQLRLAEIFYDEYSARSPWWSRKAADTSCHGRPLEETYFRRALDKYSAAEIRLGK